MGRPGHVWFRSSRNRWYFKAGGKMIDGGPDKAAAEALRARMLTDLGEVVGRLVGEAISQPGATGSVRPGTVADLVPLYLRAADITRKTRVDYADRLAWLVRTVGSKTVEHLDAEDIEAAARLAGWTNNTRRQTLAVIQGFVRWCRRKEFVLRIPAAESRGDEAVLTPGEFRRILAFTGGDYHPLFRFLWDTGCRPSEGCGLTVEAVDWQSGTASLKRHKTARKGKSRIIYLTGDGLAVLSAQREKYTAGSLFRGRAGQPLTSRRAGVVFAVAAESAGVTGRVLYSCRHSFATSALRSGLSASVVAGLLGHADTKMVSKVYGHLGSDAQWMRAQAERVNRAG